MRATKKSTKTKAAPKGAASTGKLSTALAEAAWRDADRALAEALAELNELEAAIADLPGKGATKARAREALALVAQSLARAARKRGLATFGMIRATERYDAERHDLAQAGARKPVNVRIVIPGVVRGTETLVKARVVAATRARRAQR